MNGEIRQGRRPIIVTLTPTVMTLMASIFVVVLTATVFVIRLNDKIDTAIGGQRESIEKLNNMDRRVSVLERLFEQWLETHKQE